MYLMIILDPPSPEMMYFGCYTHFKILLELPYSNLNIFSTILDELENLSSREVRGGQVPVSPPGAVTVIT